MLPKAISGLIGLFFGSAGFFITWEKSAEWGEYSVLWVRVLSSVIIATILVVLTAVLTMPFARSVKKLTNYWADRLSKMPVSRIVGGVIGLIAGLIIAILINTVLSNIYIIGPYLSILTILVLGYMGMYVGVRRTDDFTAVTERLRVRNERVQRSDDAAESKNKVELGPNPKVLDTSVIIDGRITDICRTGFVEGTLVIPGFVLEELRHIADSYDGLKRARGRRGLDILNTLRQELEDRVVISEADFPKIEEVDSKLVKLAQQLNGTLLTNDYNLNKVAKVQQVPILNINELSNAVKPVVLPGEEMTITVLKDGKEQGQGIAYLDDGTMIVVEGGKGLIGQTITTVVTSILQTAAGRMIFVRPK